MPTPENFSVEDGYVCFRPVGEFTLEAITRSIDEAIAHCGSNGMRDLLVDVREVTGFSPPTIAERFNFISQWAATSGGRVRLVVVARPEMVLEDKFGVTIASNRGMISNVFTEYDEAVEWLTNNSSRPLGKSA